MQITISRLEQILKEHGVNEEDRQEIIKKAEGKVLDNIINEVVKGKEKKGNNGVKEKQTAKG